jgi:hypothetical protein
MHNVSRRLAFILIIVGLVTVEMSIPRQVAAACSCRPDLVLVMTDALGGSNNGCSQARNRSKNAAKLGTDDICFNLGYMGGSCNQAYTCDPCQIYPGPEYLVYCEVVASCIVCT